MKAAQEATGSIAGSLAGNMAGPVRQKTWEEMSLEEGVEAMREEVRWLRRIVTDLETAARKVKNHQHAQDGSVLVPMLDRHDDDRPRGYFYDPLK